MITGRELANITAPVAYANGSALDRRFADVFKQFPFKLAATIAVAAGWVLLHMYVASIDYVPHDLLALVGYAGMASAWLLVLWILTTLVMFGPAAAVHAYEVDNPPIPALFAGQAAGALLLAAVAWPEKSIQFWLAIGSGVFAGLTVLCLAKESPRRNLPNMFLAFFAPVGGGLSAVLGVLILVQASGVGQPQFDTGWRLAAGGAVLLLIFRINVWAATRRKRMTIVWPLCAAVVAVLFVLMTKWWYVPTVIAMQIGLKLPGVTTLSVNRATCDRLMAVTERTRTHNDAGPVPQCSEAANYVTAEVQLRWGARWLLSLRTINGLQISDTAPRVVVPDDGTFLLLPTSTAPR
ncbi:hypothetical protein AVME950_04990 [Acidovorax sp. SUPP950]|uniref:hypothetical protein n=1 Tax=Acidovorax sp. SUPP950 TaxID=511901 RepID=UPI0023BC2956|nr:hypothetical protein [Acidovorax sp. SUPP950]GKS74216.1 hypothetical protein AVME950_04990 [Acidovorax sp. SUPP950]